MERHRASSVAGSEAIGGTAAGRAAERSGSGAGGARLGRLAALTLAALAFVALGASGPGARPGSRARGGTRTVRTIVVIHDLDDGRQYASIVNRQRPALDRMDGTLRSGDTEARVAAFLEAGQLRLIDERARYGEHGGSARNLYYVNDGKLVFFDSVRVRPREAGQDRMPARDEVLTALAFSDDGRLVGSEKTVNRQPIPLPSGDEPGIRSRFQALAGAVAAGGAPLPPVEGEAAAR